MRRVVTLSIAIVLIVSGCGGPDVRDRDVDTLARKLSSDSSPFGAPVPRDQAECVARAYLESDLEPADLKAIKAGRLPAASSSREAEELADVSTKISEDCLDS